MLSWPEFTLSQLCDHSTLPSTYSRQWLEARQLLAPLVWKFWTTGNNLCPNWKLAPLDLTNGRYLHLAFFYGSKHYEARLDLFEPMEPYNVPYPEMLLRSSVFIYQKNNQKWDMIVKHGIKDRNNKKKGLDDEEIT